MNIKKQHFVCAFVIIWFHFKNEKLEPYAFLVSLYIHHLAITSAAYVYLRTPYAYLLQPGNSYKVHINAYVHKCIYSRTKQESHRPMLEHHSSLLNCSLLQEIKGAKKPTYIWRHKYTTTVALYLTACKDMETILNVLPALLWSFSKVIPTFTSWFKHPT